MPCIFYEMNPSTSSEMIWRLSSGYKKITHLVRVSKTDIIRICMVSVWVDSYLIFDKLIFLSFCLIFLFVTCLIVSPLFCHLLFCSTFVLFLVLYTSFSFPSFCDYPHVFHRCLGSLAYLSQYAPLSLGFVVCCVLFIIPICLQPPCVFWTLPVKLDLDFCLFFFVRFLLLWSDCYLWPVSYCDLKQYTEAALPVLPASGSKPLFSSVFGISHDIWSLITTPPPTTNTSITQQEHRLSTYHLVFSPYMPA